MPPETPPDQASPAPAPDPTHTAPPVAADPPAAPVAQEARVFPPNAPLDSPLASAAADAGAPPDATLASAASLPDASSPPSPVALSARVLRVTASEVHVVLPDSRHGTVPLIEFAGGPLPVEGDAVSVIVEEDGPCGLVLSKRHADALTFWQQVAPGDELEGVVTGMNKGGLDIDIGGARAFLPASQVDVVRMKDISLLIGQHVRCVVTQVDRTTRDLVVSRKLHLERELARQRRSALERLAEGDIVAGTVTHLTSYGAFIDVGGVDGLLHMTDIAWGRVRDPREVLHVGQPLRVRILKINRETGRLCLGLKQLSPDPWDGIEQRYPPGRRVTARVARLTDFGAFVELEEGVDALLPIGELSWSRHVSHPGQIVQIGQTVEVAVLTADPSRKRISVSLKQTQANPWETAAERFPVGSRVTGRVTRIAAFGAFVEIAPGLEGLVHVSELSDRRVARVEDAVTEGQEVTARVLRVDASQQRISLSLRPEPQPQPPAASLGGLTGSRATGAGRASRAAGAKTGSAASPASGKKGRKRPLRGGLSSHFEW